jgi:alkaline phosphatase D
MNAKLIIALVCLAHCTVIAWGQATLVSGPMLGHIDMRSASIWVQTSASADVSIQYRTADGQRVYQSPPTRTNAHTGYCATVVLDSVEPQRTYTYDILIDGKKASTTLPTTFTTRPIWRFRGNTIPTVSIALGSCHYVNESGFERYDSTGKERGYGTPTGIFEAIADRKPDAMVWLGDNTYFREGDVGSRAGLFKRHAHTRAWPGTKRMFATVPNYAIWDDHDYGPNDADYTYALKHDARDAFMAYWPNPSYGIGVHGGITTTFDVADVQVFLMDDRWYRTPNARTDIPRRILGEEQTQWLIDALASSKATFKVVAIGGQVLSDNMKREGFAWSPEERDTIIAAITRLKISGVMFMSGDVHFAELSKLDRPGTYPLYELTSSPLSSGVNTSEVYRTNSRHVEGTKYIGHNFGLITAQGNRGDRSITLRIVDAQGKDVWSRTVHEKELR